MVSIHGDSYENFWHKTFPPMLEESLCTVMHGCGGMISFGPVLSELELYFNEDITAEKPETLCQELNLDYTQTISCKLRFDRSSEPHTIRLGRIPKETKDGNFIINGKERVIIAQLRRGPGLAFHHEKVERSYRNPDGGKYAVDKIRYSARLIPSDGVWLEFDTFKTPEEQKGLLPLEIWESITQGDGLIRVRVRRDRWFSVADLFRALRTEPPSDIPLGEPNHAVKHGEADSAESEEEEREGLGEGDEWRKIGQCVGVRPEKKRENEVEQKKRIREELLDRNYLSELGRYQVNRRLNRIRGHLPQSSPSLTAEDIEGICRYLSGLCNGLDFPVDDKYSLGDKRVRLIGDLLGEEIVPRALRHLERSVKRKIEYGISKTLEAGEFAKLVERSILGCDTFQTIRKQLFAASELSHIVPRENLLERKATHRRITLFGPGGISSTHVKEVRDLHWTHYGRLCPVDTPQSDRLGLTLSIPLEARISHLGLIEVPLHRLTSKDNGSMEVQEDEVVYLSAAQEEDEKPWIAYFDQREVLCSGKAVWARCGSMECQLVDSRNIRYIDALPHQQFSLAARLVPFLQHNDANRVLMACSAMRQALPLKEPEPPLVQTGYERILADGGDARGLGKNLLVAYMPYKGLNFEDAVVISESASRKLEHVQCFDYSVEIKETTVVTDQDTGNPKRRTVRQEITRDIHCSDARKNKLDKDGIIRKGEWVEPGDVLVGIVDPHLRESMSLFQMAAMALRKGTVSPGDHSFRVPKGEWGRVVEVKSISAGPGYRLPRGVIKIVRIQVESPPKPLKVGDKVANRHGGKGVVSVIQPDEEMPYFNDPWSHHEHDGLPTHTHVEMVLNPLGVISRLNLGQLYETHMGWFAHKVGRGPLDPIPPFSDSLGILKQAFQDRLAPLDHNGQAYLTDPLTKEQTKAPVTIGYAYMLKLNHLAEKKVHGRGFAMHKYSAVSQQPLQGKRREGGQRVGEMEICALEAHNARHIIQEMLTLKSDNPSGRELLYHAQKFGGRSSEPSPGQPGFLKVLAFYLLCCGLKLDFLDSQGNPIDFLNPKWPIRPERVAEVGIRPASRSDIAHFSAGSISNPDSGTERGGYTDDGIFSQTIFGPLLDWTCRCGVIHPSSPASTGRCEKCGVEITTNEARRLRIGHIDLPHPVFNVAFMHVASRLLGISTESLKRFLVDEPHVSFGRKPDALLFIGLLLVASEEFRTYFEKRMKLGGSSYNSDYPSLKKLLGDTRLDSIRAIINEGLSKSGSSITLLGRLLSSFTEERLREIRVVLVDELIALMREEKGTARQEQIEKRLEVIDSFIRSHIPVSHLMIEIMPVLPPGLRPPLVMENGAVVLGDLNHLYEDLLRFLKAMKLKPQADIGRNDIRELQRHVSAVIDNRKAIPPLRDRDGKAFVRSLAHFLKGKSGFFRRNLLGKRVDYSGRAVIVPDLELDLDQCALPYAMAVEIFMPLLIPRLRDLWAVSGPEGREKSLSDRAIETRIRRTLRLSSDHRNIAEDRALVVRVLEEIGTRNPVLFNRQPTLHRLGIQAFYPKVSSHEAISMHPLVTAGFNADFDGDTAAIHRVVTARALEEVKGLLAHNHLFSPANGSLTLNLGQDVALGAYFLTTSEKGRKILAEAAGSHDPEGRLNKKGLSSYLRRALSQCPIKDRATMVEKMKRLLFREASSSGLSLSILDLPDMRAVRDGLIGDDDSDPTHILSAMEERLLGFFRARPDHPLSIMHDSGARGDKRTMLQVIGMRGPMGKIGARNGSACPPVVFSSLREGMKTGEYFVSCYGSRTTLVDKKMGTAEAGYVTRKLVEITHPLYVTTEDCMSSGQSARPGLEIGPYTKRWLDVSDSDPESLSKKLEDKFIITLLWDIQGKDDGKPFLFEGVESLFDEKVIGRIERRDLGQRLLGVKIREERSRDDLVGKLMGRVLIDPLELEGEVIHQIDREDVAARLAGWVLTRKGSIIVRSPLTCEADYGVCQRCYGLDLTTMKLPEIGHKAGIVAAQSIGEPGTQLVLRNFHSGGVMGAAGISQDIPRVERFLNAKSLAQTEAQEKGLGVDSYPMLIDEIKGIYNGNGVKISDQHFEILLKGMISRFYVTDPGSDLFYPGQLVEKPDLAIAGGQVRARPMLSGIGILKRRSTGWLSSASFENTLDILAMAAIGGKTDRLLGLKGNVILGRLLPP